MANLTSVGQELFRQSPDECVGSLNGREVLWHQEFLAYILPAVQSIARNRFRGLPASEREDSQAVAVAGAMISFVRLLERGKNPTAFAGRLALNAVLLVLSGRLTSCPDRSRDVLSRLARRRRGFTVKSLGTTWKSSRNGWHAILVEDQRCTPAEIATSRLDFADWLGRMSHRRRQIAEALGAGFRTEEVADIFNVTRGRISQLRRSFEASWRKFQQETPQTAPNRRPTAV